MTKKNLLIVCGTAIATSTVVAEYLKENLPKCGIEIGHIAKCKASEAKERAKIGKFDIIITTTLLSSSDFDVPVVKTLAFLTGRGENEALAEIAGKLKGE